jgi:carboxyl-terminal processing protease
VAGVLDPHTEYLPPSDKANFDIAMTGSLEGIGAVLRERDHYVEVAELVPGGAAWREGHLTAGDLILSVTSEGKDTDRHRRHAHRRRGEDDPRPQGDPTIKLKVKTAAGVSKKLEITRDRRS